MGKEWEVLVGHLSGVGMHKAALAIKQELRGENDPFTR